MKKHCWLSFISACLFVSSSMAEPLIAPDRQEQLLNILYQDCGSCHGLTLAGGLGPSLQAEVLQAKPDVYLTATIMEGRPDTAMPPWKTFFSPEEARWLVNYLKQTEKHER